GSPPWASMQPSRSRHPKKVWQSLLVPGHRHAPPDGMRLIDKGVADAGLSEEMSRQQAVEGQEQQGATRRDHQPQRAERAYVDVVKEEGQGACADHAAGNAHQDRGQRPARVAPRHDRLGQQSDHGTEPYPYEDVISPLAHDFRKLETRHGYPLLAHHRSGSPPDLLLIIGTR